jgi:hypothetical protein
MHMALKLEYTLCRTRHNTPLVTLDSPLRNGQDMDPVGIRALAQALLQIAKEAEQQEMRKYYRPVKRTVDLG